MNRSPILTRGLFALCSMALLASQLSADTVTGNLSVEADTTTNESGNLSVDGDITIERIIGNQNRKFDLLLTEEGIEFKHNQGVWVWSSGTTSTDVMALGPNNILSLYDRGVANPDPAIVFDPGNPDASPVVPPSITIGGNQVLTTTALQNANLNLGSGEIRGNGQFGIALGSATPLVNDGAITVSNMYRTIGLAYDYSKGYLNLEDPTANLKLALDPNQLVANSKFYFQGQDGFVFRTPEKTNLRETVAEFTTDVIDLPGKKASLMVGNATSLDSEFSPALVGNNESATIAHYPSLFIFGTGRSQQDVSHAYDYAVIDLVTRVHNGDPLNPSPAIWSPFVNKDLFSISNNGQEPALRIAANSNVGLGTKNPQARLHVMGDAKVEGNLTLGGVITSAGSPVLTSASALASGFVKATNGVIDLTGPSAGLSADGASIFSLDANGKVLFSNNRPTAITSTTVSTSSNTGALTVAGGLGVEADSYINGVRIGRGTGNHLNSTAFGANALYLNTTGASNTAIGANTLYHNTSGVNNTAIGESALYKNTIGFTNTAIGKRSLYENTSGIMNMANGNEALYNNTTGSFNVASGSSALSGNITGNSNAALGKGAGGYNTTGSKNLFLGRDAGSKDAEQEPLTDPESSIYIGAYSRGKDNNDSNSIVIGADAVGDGANTTVIGNSSTTQTRLYGETILTPTTANAGDALIVEGRAAINGPVVISPPDPEGGNALVIDGHTVLNGRVIITHPQGDISMGEFTN